MPLRLSLGFICVRLAQQWGDDKWISPEVRPPLGLLLFSACTSWDVKRSPITPTVQIVSVIKACSRLYMHSVQYVLVGGGPIGQSSLRLLPSQNIWPLPLQITWPLCQITWPLGKVTWPRIKLIWLLRYITMTTRQDNMAYGYGRP